MFNTIIHEMGYMIENKCITVVTVIHILGWLLLNVFAMTGLCWAQ